MVKWIKNNTGSTKTYSGQDIISYSYYEIQPGEEFLFANDSLLLADIGSGDAIVSKDGTSNTDIVDVNAAINYLKDQLSREVEVAAQPPFANKLIDGKKIYNRVTGKTFSLQPGTNICDFSIPYAHMKIVGVEIINGQLGDTVNFSIHDDTSGTYSGIANLELNQFGFDVNIASDYYKRVCSYDADVYLNMKLKMTYESQSIKTLYVNYLIHEIKD